MAGAWGTPGTQTGAAEPVGFTLWLCVWGVRVRAGPDGEARRGWEGTY